MTLNDRDRYGEKKSQRNFLPYYIIKKERKRKNRQVGQDFYLGEQVYEEANKKKKNFKISAFSVSIYVRETSETDHKVDR